MISSLDVLCLLVIAIVEVLSHMRGVVSTCNSPKSLSMNLSQIVYNVAYEAEALTYSFSAVDIVQHFVT